MLEWYRTNTEHETTEPNPGIRRPRGAGAKEREGWRR
jgi:hypothetical protein